LTGGLSGALAGGEPGSDWAGPPEGELTGLGSVAFPPLEEPTSPDGLPDPDAGCPLSGGVSTGATAAGGVTTEAGGGAGAIAAPGTTVAGFVWSEPLVVTIARPTETAAAPMAATTAAATTAFLPSGHRFAAGLIGSGGNSAWSARYPSSVAGSPSALDDHADAMVGSAGGVMWLVGAKVALRDRIVEVIGSR
jgi:hypothetical protein